MFNKRFQPQQQPQQPRIRINEQIRNYQIMLADDFKQGIMTPDEARKIAYERNLDLVEVAPQAKPPVCRIMDYDKFKYEQALKEKEKRKKQKQNQSREKEIVLSPVIEDHDLATKSSSARKFLVDGCRVRVRLQYKRRQNAHKELGFEVMKKFVESLIEVGTVQQAPRLEGNFLNCVIDPKGK